MTAIPQVDPATFQQAQPSSTCVKTTSGRAVTPLGAKHITLGTIAERLEEPPAPGEDFTSSATAAAFEPRGNLPARARLRRTTCGRHQRMVRCQACR